MDRQPLAGFFDELDKLSQFGGDIDDLYAAPNSSIVPTLKRVHNLGKTKGSSWTDIGPVGQREGRAAKYPQLPFVRDKIAGRLQNLYNTAYLGATHAAHNPAAHAVAKGIASGAMKGNPVRVAGGIAEGAAKSETAGRVLDFLRRRAKAGLQVTREAVYPSPGKLVHASVKTAEPPPPPGVTLEQWDKILQRKSKSKEMAKDAAALKGRKLELLRKALRENADSDVFSRLRGLTRPKHRKGFAKRMLLIAEPPKPPTGGVKVAYKLQGHTTVQGMRIAIENRKGSVRTGKSREGVEWRTKMIHPYGYIVGTKAKDDEPVDVYVGPDKEAPDAYVVHQHKPDGTGFDEDKVMLGFRSKKEAKEAFLKHYDSPKFLGPISRVSVQRLRELVRSKKKLVKITG